MAAVALVGGAALGLLEELGEDAAEGDDQADKDQGHRGSAPEADVAGRAGDLRDIGEGEREGDEGEDAESGCEDVKVASHAADQAYRFERVGWTGRSDAGAVPAGTAQVAQATPASAT